MTTLLSPPTPRPPDMLRKKDEQIVALLEEKMKVFRDMCECGSPVEEQSSRGRVLFRASSQDVPRGEPIMKDALHEGEWSHQGSVGD